MVMPQSRKAHRSGLPVGARTTLLFATAKHRGPAGTAIDDLSGNPARLGGNAPTPGHSEPVQSIPKLPFIERGGVRPLLGGKTRLNEAIVSANCVLASRVAAPKVRGGPSPFGSGSSGVAD